MSLCPATPTPGELIYKWLFHGGVNPVNSLRYLSNNKYYTILSFPCGYSCLPVDAVFSNALITEK